MQTQLFKSNVSTRNLTKENNELKSYAKKISKENKGLNELARY